VTSNSCVNRSAIGPGPVEARETIGDALDVLLSFFTWSCVRNLSDVDSSRITAWACPLASRVGSYHKFSGLGPPPPLRQDWPGQPLLSPGVGPTHASKFKPRFEPVHRCLIRVSFPVESLEVVD
jgi:hypothetical protein